MLFSLPLEGNVLSYEIREPASEYGAAGTNVWEKHGSNGVYLKRATLDEYLIHEGRKSSKHVEYETLAFDPNFVACPDRFELSSLSLPGGTLVENLITGRRYRVGDRLPEAVEERLRPLIESMKTKGFMKQR